MDGERELARGRPRRVGRAEVGAVVLVAVAAGCQICSTGQQAVECLHCLA